ncbi:hypothetical protein Agabi119p4_2573 [Agaricus bisporus var. burnettii]|uniref:Uncharacterized protein n=1 Tax=Agaricus bisporus var. burnettii TaxID=192524 RepID=A0A8H7KKA8_AGABI|nr:hypothetical protein Agabi119p4_2573 [Agaricus bisporus var. burnettii]
MLPVIDLAHRGLLFSLVGITAYGFYLGYAGHSARMERGKGGATSRRAKEIREVTCTICAKRYPGQGKLMLASATLLMNRFQYFTGPRALDNATNESSRSYVVIATTF